jgi:hypothetical protein
MAGLAPKLPLTYSSIDGFMLIKDFPTMIKQNLKMLILTIPGERVMEPEFGVGITRYLFENFQSTTYSSIDSRIREQVKTYMPFVAINDITFNSTGADRNILGVSIKYSIPRLNARDLLEFTI